MTHAPEPVSDDPAITALLERLDVPDHRPGFWDDLARAMVELPEQADPSAGSADGAEPVPLPTTAARPSVRRLLLVAAAMALVAASAVAVVHRNGGQGRIQTVDTGPAVTSTTATTATGSSSAPTTVVGRTDRAEAVNDLSVVGGSAGGWFFSDRIAWAGDEFVATPQDDPSSHWSSPDGISWSDHDEPNPVLAAWGSCPEGYDCEVSPAAPEIPFHFAQPFHQVVAKAGDRLLLEAGISYRFDAEGSVDSDEENAPASPTLHPELLAAAAETKPCFRDLQRQTGAGGGTDSPEKQARLSAWSSGGLSDPVIKLTCAYGTDDVAGFTLDLRDHLTDEQLQAVYGPGPRELWVATPGSPAARVDDPPTTTYPPDEQLGGVAVTQPSSILSTGDRFWALDGGSLATSSDGSAWTPRPVATGGLDIADLAASPGGHLVLRLVADRQAPSTVGRVIVSHDEGASWSQPVEVVGAARLWVGPAGAVVLDDTESGATVSLVDGGSARTVFTADTNVVSQVTVGEDRLLVRSLDFSRPDSPERFTVYDLDGNPLHQAVYDESAGGRRTALWAAGVIAITMATAIGAAAWFRRRRSRAARAGTESGAVQ